ncbi:MAG: hypothetical protein LKE53_06425 [Oscillospiraceae bacterium]|jgi:hypothetical protein|nr:hypothetical protein [Oscillospiraceae bacterium]
MSIYPGETVWKHPAEIIGKIDGAVVLADDDDKLFLYPFDTDCEDFNQVGLAMDVEKDKLIPAEKAESPLKERLITFLRGKITHGLGK